MSYRYVKINVGHIFKIYYRIRKKDKTKPKLAQRVSRMLWSLFTSVLNVQGVEGQSDVTGGWSRVWVAFWPGLGKPLNRANFKYEGIIISQWFSSICFRERSQRGKEREKAMESCKGTEDASGEDRRFGLVVGPEKKRVFFVRLD